MGLSPIVVNVKKLIPTAYVPDQQTDGSAGADLRASESIVIAPGTRSLVKTGIAVDIPAGHVGFVCSRSGLALKKGVFVLNAPGVIDSDYRGEVGVILQNSGDEAFQVLYGDRVAQLVIVAARYVAYEPVDSLDETVRGVGGFGSTGIA